MECGNLVPINDSYGPPIPYLECGNLVPVSDSYGPPYLIWNRYLMPMTLKVPHTVYGIGISWSPLPYMEQVSYGLPPYVQYFCVDLSFCCIILRTLAFSL